MSQVKTQNQGYLFETSWEVCNKVGGIYTVLASKAKCLKEQYGDNLIFIGPDIWTKKESLWFNEDETLLEDWRLHAREKDALKLRIGRWDVEGQPIAILVDYQDFFLRKDEIYGEMWEDYKVDSLHAYGDYDESCMFAYATGCVIKSFYEFFGLIDEKVIAHFDEWMLGMGLLFVKSNLPKVATVFTTHATSIGRSIAGNNKPLYNYLTAYNGDQMARELNMVAKHSIEKKAARNADCFTTVSDITALECTQLLERKPFVTPNGFEQDMIPTGEDYDHKRKEARKALINVVEKLLGQEIDDDAVLVATSGRYEFKNKGIDVFIEALHKLKNIKQLKKDVVAFIMVPAWMKEPRADLMNRLDKKAAHGALEHPFLTHWLHNMHEDLVLRQIDSLGFRNLPGDRVKIVFVPSYLNGEDGIFNMSYYDLLIGLDVTAFPSYYEPWGYTPHESIAFSIPTITTTLAGFGLWNKKLGDKKGLEDGVEVVFRDDYNYHEVAEDISNLIFEVSVKSSEEERIMRNSALERSLQADWSHFIKYYYQVYNEALEIAKKRV
ncbi:MAG: glycogen/starch synthase [Dysgonamonadaceae bacterium]